MAGAARRRWARSWARRAAVAAAPAGALSALLLVLLAVREPVPALFAYVAGAAAAGLLGYVLGGAAGMLRRPSGARSRARATRWVVHRAGAVTGAPAVRG